jgi:hypothetical protein
MQHWDKSKDEKRDLITRQTNKRKSTAKWCKGKAGVEHTPEIVVNHNFTARLRACEWRPVYTRRTGIVQVWKWHYSCVHALQCTSCGKYIEWIVAPEQCPDFKPREE